MAVRMICAKCGSDDVTNDALARWCVESQAWEISSVLDNANCEACDGDETHLEEEVIAPLPAKPLPRIIVSLDEGIVSAVFCDVPAQVLRLDWDVEGSSDDETIPLVGTRAFASMGDADKWEPATELLWAEARGHLEAEESTCAEVKAAYAADLRAERGS